MTGEDVVHVTASVPGSLVDERLLVEIVNALHAEQDLVRSRGGQGFFRALLEQLNGHSRSVDRVLADSAVSIHDGTFRVFRDLSHRLDATNMIVGEVLEEMLRLHQGQKEIEELKAIAGYHEQRLAAHEERIAALERHHAATEALRLWEGTDINSASFPWLVRAFLAARVAAAAVSGVALESGVAERNFLGQMLSSGSRARYAGVRATHLEIGRAVGAMPSARHQAMVAEILGHGVEAPLAIRRGALSSLLADAMAAASRGEAVASVPVPAFGHGADHLPVSMQFPELVRRAVFEQFAEARLRRARAGGRGTDG
jgi:hypothetical protein